MISRILFFLAALIFSSSVYADTYYFQGVKEKDANGKEYLIFNDGRVDIGLKIDENDKLQLVPMIPKTDFIAKQKKIDEGKKKTTNIQNFVNNFLKLSITFFGMIIIALIFYVLYGIIWIIVGVSTIFKKS